MNNKEVFTAIIGAGASGLAAAIVLGRRIKKTKSKQKIIILEKQSRPGKKLLATGGGRCNLSNIHASSEFYYGDNGLISPVFDIFSFEDTARFFDSLGMLIRTDEAGRVYPYSGKSATVLDCLCAECERLNVSIQTDCTVSDIRRQKGKYLVTTSQGIISAQNIVLASGTAASPMLGGSDVGFSLLSRLGLDIKPPLPALTSIRSEKHYPLKGVRAKGTVCLLADGKAAAQSSGEIQFTDNGLSGICVFDLSRKVSEYLNTKTVNDMPCKKIALSVDLFPEYTISELCTYLNKQKNRINSQMCETLLHGALDYKLCQALIKYCHFEEVLASALSPKDIKTLAVALKNFSFIPVECSLQNAQVCAGGAGSKDIDPYTMQCKKHKGLYVTGELLNVDGICGGFNLQWAWATGYIAGMNIPLLGIDKTEEHYK